MNKFETPWRIFSTALAVNVGLVAVHSQEVSAAPKPKLTCTTVSPKYEKLVAGHGILFLAEPGGNEQRYQITESHTQGVVDISQVELHKNKIEITKELDLTKITTGHDIAVNFHDASGVTMQFRGVDYISSGPQGGGEATIDPFVCKAPEVYIS